MFLDVFFDICCCVCILPCSWAHRKQSRLNTRWNDDIHCFMDSCHAIAVFWMNNMPSFCIADGRGDTCVHERGSLACKNACKNACIVLFACTRALPPPPLTMLGTRALTGRGHQSWADYHLRPPYLPQVVRRGVPLLLLLCFLLVFEAVSGAIITYLCISFCFSPPLSSSRCPLSVLSVCVCAQAW